MMKLMKIESLNAKAKNASAAMANAAAFAAYAYAVSYSLFWSVFGPAAQYGYRQPAYAYGALYP